MNSNEQIIHISILRNFTRFYIEIDMQLCVILITYLLLKFISPADTHLRLVALLSLPPVGTHISRRVVSLRYVPFVSFLFFFFFIINSSLYIQNESINHYVLLKLNTFEAKKKCKEKNKFQVLHRISLHKLFVFFSIVRNTQ